MFYKKALILGIRALKRNKMRSVLTSLGVIIGVASVIVIVGISNSAKMVVKNKINNYGTDAMQVKNYQDRFSDSDLIKIRDILPNIKYITPIYGENDVLIKYTNANTESKVFGVTNDFFKMKEWGLQEGRYFTFGEITSFSSVAIIGESVNAKLFKTTNSLGKTIIVGGKPFKVIGVLDEIGQGFSGVDFDNVVIAPYTTAGMKIVGSNRFPEIFVSVLDSADVVAAKSKIIAYYRNQYSLDNSQPDVVQVKTSAEKLKSTEEIAEYLSWLLLAVASIALFVGGVGIMNIMLVSVNERIKEIGIRKAIGAKRNDILMQFLFEAVLLSLLGGITGIIVGLVSYYYICNLVEWPYTFSLLSINLSFFFSLAVGIFFGYYPARRAALLKPIEALKNE